MYICASMYERSHQTRLNKRFHAGSAGTPLQPSMVKCVAGKSGVKCVAGKAALGALPECVARGNARNGGGKQAPLRRWLPFAPP